MAVHTFQTMGAAQHRRERQRSDDCGHMQEQEETKLAEKEAAEEAAEAERAQKAVDIQAELGIELGAEDSEEESEAEGDGDSAGDTRQHSRHASELTAPSVSQRAEAAKAEEQKQLSKKVRAQRPSLRCNDDLAALSECCALMSLAWPSNFAEQRAHIRAFY